MWDEEGIIEDPMTVAQARQGELGNWRLPWVVDAVWRAKERNLREVQREARVAWKDPTRYRRV